MMTTYRKGKQFCLEEIGVFNLMVQLSAKIVITCRNDMEEAHKAKHEESLSKNIDGIWKKVR